MIKKLMFGVTILIIFLFSCKSEWVEVNEKEQRWKNMSQKLIDLAIKNDTIDFQVQTYSSLVYAIGIVNGWNSPRCSKYLEKVYTSIDNLGYGLGYAWDAFQDRTINDKYTNYTVTMADHIGYTFLEGYKMKIIPKSRMKHLIEALLRVPKADNINVGMCYAYSDNKNDQIGCVHNVNIGVAYFFNEITKIDFKEYQLKSIVDGIIERENISYLPQQKNYYYWDKLKNITDQNHLAYQAWCMFYLDDEQSKQIANILIEEIINNKSKDLSSLIGQLRLLMINDIEENNLYNVLHKLVKNETSEYTPIGQYTFNNPRVIAQLALWSAKYYERLKIK